MDPRYAFVNDSVGSTAESPRRRGGGGNRRIRNSPSKPEAAAKAGPLTARNLSPPTTPPERVNSGKSGSLHWSTPQPQRIRSEARAPQPGLPSLSLRSASWGHAGDKGGPSPLQATRSLPELPSTRASISPRKGAGGRRVSYLP